MPEAAVWAIADTFSISVVAADAVLTTLTYVAAIAASASYASHQRAKAKANYNAGLSDRLVMTKTATNVRSVCYGVTRNVDAVLFDRTHGEYSKFRTLLVAIAGHQIKDYVQIWLNDTPVTLSPDGYVKDDPWAQFTTGWEYGYHLLGDSTTYPLPGDYSSDGNFFVEWMEGDAIITEPAPVVGDHIDCSAGLGTGATRSVYGTYTRVVSYIRIRKYLGAPTQDLSADLNAIHPDLIVTGRHKFAGIALLWLEIECGKEDARLQQVPNVSATIQGASVYDTRDASFDWSDNLALIARDWAYRAVGGNMPYPTLRDSEISAAADVCDTPLATGSPPPLPSTVPLYHGGIVCPTDQDPWEIMQELAEGMAGRIGWSGGELRVLAGAWRAPVMEITEAHLSGLGDISLAPQISIDGVYNTASVRYAADDDNTYAERTLTVALDDAVTEDGRPITLAMDMRAVTLNKRVAYVAQAVLLGIRLEQSFSGSFTHAVLELERYDTVYVTLDRYGLNLWEAEVQSVSWSRDGAVQLALKATSADAWPPTT
jgi:hypothetical protein